ncbi:MAG: AAA family ATPase [Chitinophagales bacterium]
MNFLEDSELLFEGRHSFIYLKKGNFDATPMIIKVLKEDYPLPQHILQFNNEYEITHSLNIVGIRKALEKIQLESGHFALQLKYIEGVSIRKFAKSQLIPIEDFLIIAIQLTQTLHLLHNENIIHKDLNSNNVIIEPTSLKATIIDFGISSKVGLKTPYISNPDRLEGTLTYISPEQTGRMNRKIDYRTDLYSLGVTFYELLTGKLPFTHSDPVKLIHQHLALIPNPPHFIRTDIPDQISEIVLKLMSKNAEARYQSAYGLQKDLEKCLFLLQKTKSIEVFELATNDLPNKFNISEKLYSRELATNQLFESFNFMNEGNSKLVLISGNAGIGKSTLVGQLHEPITESQGVFVTGKFDQFQNNIPYFTFIQAIEEFVEQILTESEKRLAQRKKDILRAVGHTSGILTTLIPKLKLIIGEQAKVVDSEGKEAQNRLHYAFSNLIKAIAKKRHPFVMFMDDLQWADKSSLHLLEHLISQKNIPYLLLIGAYRLNEVDKFHPFNTTLKKIQQGVFSFAEIQLNPLEINDVQQLIADTLFTTTKECHTLAELVHSKTNGNPFFIIQFLESLYEEGLLRFKVWQDSFQPKNSEQIQYKWEWNMAAIRQRNITDNVVRLLARRIKKLLPETQQILQLASCIGNRFDLNLLSLIYERSPRDTTKILQEALKEGLVIPLSEVYQYVTDEQQTQDIEYKFTHDRIRKAVYSLIPIPYQKNIHWKIGELLQERSFGLPKPQQVFEIVQQLNKGIGTIDNQEKKIKLVELNLKAGEQAKSSTAFGVAFQYFDTAISLLPNKHWKNHYQLTLLLYNKKAESAHLSGHFEECDKILETIFTNAQTPLDKSKAWQIKLFVYKAKGRIHETLQIGIEALSIFEFPLSIEISNYNVFWELTKVNFLLKQYLPKKINSLPSMEDHKYLAIIGILNQMLPAAYMSDTKLFPIIVCKQIQLSLKHGMNEEFPLALLMYSSLSINVLKNIKQGYQYGETALRLTNKLNSEGSKSKVKSVYHTFIHHWQNPLAHSLLNLSAAYKRFLSIGDFEFAGISIATYISYSVFSGKNLKSLSKESLNYYEVMQPLGVINPINRMQLYLQMIHNLMQADYPTKLSGAFFKEETTVPILKNNKSYFGLFIYNSIKLILSYLFGDYQSALKHAQTFETYQMSSTGIFSHYVFCTYDALTHLAAYPDMNPTEQKAALKHVKTIQKKIKAWKKHAPMNHSHHWHLIEAEYWRVKNKPHKALIHYKQALTSAQKGNFLSMEGITQELLAKYYLSQKEEDFAEFYFQKAILSYQKWGANSKVAQLTNTYSHYLVKPDHPYSTNSLSLSSIDNRTYGSTATNSYLLDAYHLLKTSHKLLSEIELPALFEKLMHYTMEHTGAQKGYLILVNHQRISVEAKSNISQINPNKKTIELLDSVSLQELKNEMAHIVINYVMRTQHSLVLDNAQKEENFKKDVYIIQHKILSIFCLPIVLHEKVIGLFYLENNLTTNAFSRERMEMMEALSTQMAVAITNAQLYQKLMLQNEENEEKSTRLLRQNKDLQHFTYITAHNLREPVANLLGLLELYNQEELDDPINQIVIDGFQEASVNMDNIIRDLNLLISSKNKSTNPKEQIVFSEIFNQIQLSLESLIKKEKPSIQTNFEVKNIFSIRANIYPILYHLLSNALKYRDPKKTLFINIKISSLQSNILQISIADNGLGINLDQYRHKLFSPYTRFHPHIEGKGLGLNLVQSNVENLEGRIEVESIVNKGSTFTIYLPF